MGFGENCFQKDILNLVYLCRYFNLPEVDDYWEQVVKINNYQKYRFGKEIIHSLFNTVSGKKIAFPGWAFKKDTNDTRESAAIYVAWELLQDMAEIHIYDPKVEQNQFLKDLEIVASTHQESITVKERVHIHTEPYSAMKNAHAIAILTEWDEFKKYDLTKVFSAMFKPAFVFDGRNILSGKEMNQIGFKYKGIGEA